jgi:branched-chain amino acid transport system ATP-binding protein
MTRPNAPVIDVRELTVGYGELLALKEVSLHAHAGEFVAVLGANGAGKSTLLNCIAGLVSGRGGEIVHEGFPLDRVPAHERVGRRVALVPEGRMTFGPLTIAENLRLGMLTDGWFGKRALFEQRLGPVLDLFPALKDRLGVPVGELSGGQQQMVAIGRALMSEPRLLLLDEPSLGLAPQVIDDVFAALQRLNEERGLTILLAEQNIESALELADRAYVLQVGRVALHDSASALLERTDVEDVYLGRRAELEVEVGRK